MAIPFEVRKVYSFDVYGTSILTNGFKNVTIMAILDYESALDFRDVTAVHHQVYPSLPVGTPDDPTSYDYVHVRLASGDKTVLGLPWINLTTVVEIASRKIMATIDGVSSADLDRVRTSLVQNGFNNIKLELI